MNNKLKFLFVLITIFSYNLVHSSDFRDILDFSCETTVDCSLFVQPLQNLTCLGNKCTCFNQNGQQVQCTPPESFYNNIIGGSCPCTQDNSECNTKTQICYCQREYIATIDKRRCIKKTVQLGESCENDSQCIYQEKFSECDLTKKICKCQKDFVEFNNGCISIVDLDEHCETDTQCSNKTINSFCNKKRCACEIGFVLNIAKTKCLSGVNHNENCIEDNQCKLKLGVGSTCYSGKCSCDIKHHLLEIKLQHDNKTHFSCEKDVHYGDYCYEHTDCYHYKDQTDHQSMECIHGECACRPDFINQNNTCVLNGSQSIKVKDFNMMLLFVISVVFTNLWRK